MFKRFHSYMRPDEPAATGAPAPAPAAPAPVAATPAAPAAPAEAKGNWPENWRDLGARGDTKVAERLGRYGSPEDVVSALVSAQNRISQGQLLPALGTEPTADELKEWRAAHGVPEAPDKYDLGTFKPTEAGKPMIDKYLADVAHKSNMTPEQVRANLEFIAATTVADRESAVVVDEQRKTQYEDTMRKEWGDRYRMNDNMIHGFLDGEVTQDVKAKLLDSRMPDGTKFKNDPDAMRLLVKMALVKNPAATFVPGTANPMKGVDDRLAEIKDVMRKDRKKYDGDAAMQAEYLNLLRAREKLTART